MDIPIRGTIRLDERSIERLAEVVAAKIDSNHLQNVASTDEVLIETTGLLPDSWRLVEEQDGVAYKWGEHTDYYRPFRVFEATTGAGHYRLAIGTCERTAVRGRDRRYFITHLIGSEGGKRAVAEFVETDAADGSTVAIIKGKGGGGKFYDPGDALPEPYEGFEVVTYRDYIDFPGSYNKAALLVQEDDEESMLNHTLIQVVTRGLDQE